MRYRAIVLDIDGTLVDDSGVIRPRTLESLRAVETMGVRVMLATGRSELGAMPILRELGFDTPAVVFNGAGVFCPVEERLLEQRLLAEEIVRDAHAFASEEDLMILVSRIGEKFASHPRDEHERQALEMLEALSYVHRDHLPTDAIVRVSVFSRTHAGDLAQRLSARLAEPVYLTYFPLNLLADQRDSALHVVDVQPHCQGKGEALRFLAERFSIPAESVVAVGDAQNDVPMLEAAGLGVAMENAMPSARAAADRTIGSNNSDAIAELIDELFF